MDPVTKTNSIQARLAFASTVLSVGIVTYLVIISIYRLWFHPLAKFPGPVINRISWVRVVYVFYPSLKN